MSSIRTAPLLGKAVVDAALRYSKTKRLSDALKAEPSDIKIEPSDIFDATLREMISSYSCYRKYLAPTMEPSAVLSVLFNKNEPSTALLRYLFTDDEISDLKAKMPTIKDTRQIKDFTWRACERAALSKEAEEVLRASSIYSGAYSAHAHGYRGTKGYADIINAVVEIAKNSSSNPFEEHNLTVDQVHKALDK